MGGARLKPLKRWQWVVLAALWLPGPIALLWNDYPRAEPWRQEFIRQRGRAVEVDRETAYLRVARQCQTGDKYDLISPQRRAEYLRCMDARKGELDALQGEYLKAKAGIAEEAEQGLPRERWRVIGKGAALWLVPLLGFYAVLLLFRRLRPGTSK
jgi:hypothetical protein